MDDLLAFAESVANARSSHLHGFHGHLVTAARRVVKAHGGRLDKIGRYRENSAEPKPYARCIGGQWVTPTHDPARDRWIFPQD
jgi:hypothetical protein